MGLLKLLEYVIYYWISSILYYFLKKLTNPDFINDGQQAHVDDCISVCGIRREDGDQNQTDQQMEMNVVSGNIKFSKKKNHY